MSAWWTEDFPIKAFHPLDRPCLSCHSHTNTHHPAPNFPSKGLPLHLIWGASRCISFGGLPDLAGPAHLPHPTSLWVLATRILFDHHQLDSVSACRTEVTPFRAVGSHSPLILPYCNSLLTQLPPALAWQESRAQGELGHICSSRMPERQRRKRERMDKRRARC